MRYIFIDFEASSLWAGGSYPIEVGWCDVDGNGAGVLIRHNNGWCPDWSWQSEQVHRITRQMLADQGLPAVDVARHLLSVVGAPDVLLVSDAPDFDSRWLRSLLDTAGRTMPLRPLKDLDEVLGLECLPLLGLPLSEMAVADLALDIVVRAQEAEGRVTRRRHRALEDAQGLAFRYRFVRQEVLEQTGGSARSKSILGIRVPTGR
jgi:hypothetical protein